MSKYIRPVRGYVSGSSRWSLLARFSIGTTSSTKSGSASGPSKSPQLSSSRPNAARASSSTRSITVRAMRRPPRTHTCFSLPDILLLPTQRRKVAVAAVRDDRHDATRSLVLLQPFRDLHCTEEVCSRRVPDVQPLLASESVGHVPAVFGRHGDQLVMHRRVV